MNTPAYFYDSPLQDIAEAVEAHELSLADALVQAYDLGASDATDGMAFFESLIDAGGKPS